MRVIESSDSEQESPSTSSAKSGTGRPHSSAQHSLKPSVARNIQENLATWFLTVHDARGMPWRKQYDPSLPDAEKAQRAYEVGQISQPKSFSNYSQVWVSEIMLQQTRVETGWYLSSPLIILLSIHSLVIPYYLAWMKEFPTIHDLAKSNIEVVNSLWKGLGYYSRAARLLEGARIVVSEHSGKLPEDAVLLQKSVPGIGRYSAGAICSIAYGKCVPVLDGNVHRLLSRVIALHAPPKSKAVLDLLWDAAEAIVKGTKEPGAINQALIELGSTVCTPKDPKCGGCPIKADCRAFGLKQVRIYHLNSKRVLKEKYF